MNRRKRYPWIGVVGTVLLASSLIPGCGDKSPESASKDAQCYNPNQSDAKNKTCEAYFNALAAYSIAGNNWPIVILVINNPASKAPAPACPPILFDQGPIEALSGFDSTGSTLYTVPLFRQPDGNYTAQGFSLSNTFTQSVGTNIGSLTKAQTYFASCRTFSPWTPAPHPTVLADIPGAMSRDDVVTSLGGASYAAIRVKSGTNLITVLLDTQATLGSSYTDYQVGPSPTSILTGDFNGDGKRDVATVNQSGFDSAGNGSVSILLGNGNGTLRQAVNYSTGGQTPVAMTSFNLNGRANLAVVNQQDNTVTILLSNADGSMRTAVTYPLPGQKYVAQPTAIVAADFDGDGKTDLMVYGGFYTGFALLRGNGDGSFQAAVQKTGYAINYSPIYLAAGDFNKDGKMDLASLNSDGTVAILLNAGDGGFPNSTRYVVGTPLSSGAYAVGMFAMDFNDDGNLDLVFAGGHPDALFPGPLFVTALVGRGDGTFQGAAPAYPVGIGAVAMATADFNGDGHRDLVAAAGGSGPSPSLWILTGQGGGFQPTEVSMPSFYAAKWVATADLNGDGRADLIAIDNIYQHDGHVYAWLGKGDGTFQAPSTYSAGIQPTFVTAGDVNGDGLPDLLISYGYEDATTAGATTALLLTAKSGGGFNAGVAIPTGVNTVQVALADVNGDGKPDLVAVNLGIADTGYGGAMPAPGNVSVSLGNGNGTFKAPVNYTVGVNPTWVAVGDVNGDGRPDLVVGAVTATQAKIGVLLGGGNGTFGAATLFDTYSWPSRLTLTDFDGDGKLDLAMVHEAGDSPVTVMQGNGDGTFQPETLVFAGDGPVAVVAADFTGKGRSDLAVLNQAFSGWGSVNLFRNISAAPACSYSLSGGSQSFTATAGTGSFQVTAGSGCNWSAAGSVDWIRPAFPGFGVGAGAVNFSVLANTGAARSGTVTVGGQTFTVNQASGATGGPPQAVSVNPGAGNVSPQTFTFTYSDPDGYQDLDVVNVLINTALDGRNACYLAYSRPSNVLYLVNDPGTALLPGLVLAGSGSVSNSQCTVTGAGSSASGAGNALTLTLNLSFPSTFAGNRLIYLAARSNGDVLNSGWQAVGSRTVQ